MISPKRWRTEISPAILAFLLTPCALPAARPIPCDPDNGGLKLPPGYCAAVVADGLGAVAARADGVAIAASNYF